MHGAPKQRWLSHRHKPLWGAYTTLSYSALHLSSWNSRGSIAVKKGEEREGRGKRRIKWRKRNWELLDPHNV